MAEAENLKKNFHFYMQTNETRQANLKTCHLPGFEQRYATSTVISIIPASVLYLIGN
jgi:hypothetical protein